MEKFPLISKTMPAIQYITGIQKISTRSLATPLNERINKGGEMSS